jgi:phospholipid-translocating ATPase
LNFTNDSQNLVWTFALFWYQIYANFDCGYLYDYSYIIMFNLAFTSLPVILMGVFDQDVSDQVSLANPQLYKRGIERKEWTQPKFWAYMLDGLYQSVLVFWLALFLFGPGNSVTTSGLDVADVKRVGVYVAGGAVLIVNLYVLFNTYRWDWLTVLINVISTLLFFFWTGAYTSSSASDYFYHAAAECFAQGSFWALVFSMVIICLLPRYTTKSGQQIFFPREVDTLRRQVKRGDYDYLKNYEDDLFPPNPHKFKQSHSSSSSAHPLRRGDEEATIGTAPGTATSAARLSSEPPQMAENRLSVENQANNKLRNSAVSSNRMSASPRPSMDRSRTSYERARNSMDRMRPSFENSDHVTSAAMLTRMSSAGSGQGIGGSKYNPARGRGNTIGEEI